MWIVFLPSVRWKWGDCATGDGKGEPAQHKKRTYKHDDLDSFALETMCARGPAELLHSVKETKENPGEEIKVCRSRLLFVDISI